MTNVEASERMLSRWSHQPLDVVDVEERIALRLVDVEGAPETRVLPALNACRIFVRIPERDTDRVRGWCSRFVHAVADVDDALSWIARRTGSSWGASAALDAQVVR